MAIKVEEKSLQLALVKAAGQLGITQDELAYKVLEKNSGFLGMFGKKISIEAWRKNHRSNRANPRQQHEANHRKSKASQDEAAQADKRELTSSEIAELKDNLQTFCAGLCQLMTNETVKVQALIEEERLVLDIDSDYLAGQIVKNTKLAEAMEHILRKKPRHLRQELPFRIFVDVRGMRRARENELIDMAQDLSNKVHENKRPIVLNYRSSYDRKIIHMALDKDDRVYTKSIGSGPNRKLMILPSKEHSQEVNA